MAIGPTQKTRLAVTKPLVNSPRARKGKRLALASSHFPALSSRSSNSHHSPSMPPVTMLNNTNRKFLLVMAMLIPTTRVTNPTPCMTI